MAVTLVRIFNKKSPTNLTQHPIIQRSIKVHTQQTSSSSDSEYRLSNDFYGKLHTVGPKETCKPVVQYVLELYFDRQLLRCKQLKYIKYWRCHCQMVIVCS
jgi:hypothetical protein